MRRGVLVSFEGGEGSGKSTMHRLSLDWLKDIGIEPISPREPGGTVTGEAVRELLLHREECLIHPLAELLLFEAARAQLVEEILLPALAAGGWVHMDRYYDSSTAYQGFGRGLGYEKVRRLNKLVAGRCQPDLTLVLDIDADAGLARATRAVYDRMEAEDIAFHHKVVAGFRELANREPDRVKLVDASAPIEQVFEEVKLLLTPCLEKYLAGERG